MFGAFQPNESGRDRIGSRALDRETGKDRMVRADSQILRCNLTDLSADQVGFVANAAPRPAWNELRDRLPRFCSADDEDRQFVRSDDCIVARCVCEHGLLSMGKVRETPVMELRRFIGSGFRAARSPSNLVCRIFSAAANCQKIRIPDRKPISAPIAQTLSFTRCAGRASAFHGRTRSDCASDLDLVARSATPGTSRITAEDLQRGTIVHLGTHVAAVIEDRNPIGILDENDLVAHQLPRRPGNCDAWATPQRARKKLASICFACRQQNPRRH